MHKHKAAGLIYGSNLHHLDHVGPLCILLGIPLFVTEDFIEKLGSKYYPELVIFTFSEIEIAQKMTAECDVVISSMPRAMINQIFFLAEKLARKKLLSIWCPHGNSDKGYLAPFMEALKEEKIALCYGSKMIDFLKEKNVYKNLYKCIEVGNYRKNYYLRLKPYYDQFIENEITRRLNQENKTILYAPTWNDSENSCSLFDALPILAKTLPKNYNLIVKLHPNMLHEEIEPLILEFEMEENILFIQDFPLIYPLLSAIDIYVGDMSSIGYDFLFFNKPMFFINTMKRDSKTDKGLYLYRCGITLEKMDLKNLYEIIENDSQEDLQEIREITYEYTFTKNFTFDRLKNTIVDCYETYLEEEIDLL
ncbi:MAG: CDP-glycerol glycerophosphotransferase family protein [Simkaniaceae bacterium]|nr:CDP-glycerol glycerophosphotransferase family protein [Simkaniaceae bacterium]